MADGGKGGDEYLFKVLVVGAVTPNAPPPPPAHFTPTGCHGLAVGMGNGGQGQRTAQAGPGQRRAARQGGQSGSSSGSLVHALRAPAFPRGHGRARRHTDIIICTQALSLARPRRIAISRRRRRRRADCARRLVAARRALSVGMCTITSPRTTRRLSVRAGPVEALRTLRACGSGAHTRRPACLGCAGADFALKIIRCKDGNVIRLQLWDIAGVHATQGRAPSCAHACARRERCARAWVVGVGPRVFTGKRRVRQASPAYGDWFHITRHESAELLNARPRGAVG